MGNRSPGRGLGPGYGIFIYFFLEQKMFWSKGIQDELIRNKNYIFCPACSESLMNFMLMGRVT